MNIKFKRTFTIMIPLSLLAILSLFLGGHGNADHHASKAGDLVSFVIVGGTGDLAKRKIWPSLAELVLKEELDLSSVHFYAGSRDTASVTRNLLTSYFSQLGCESTTNLMQCDHEFNYQLSQSITAVALKTSEDYADLNREMNKKMSEVGGQEILRIFYLAVPPFAYSGIIANINEFCRPPSETTELRVAIEKPFGRDLNSAQILATDMRKFLKDEEIYLVDHYLHKDGVKQMRSFLSQNSVTLQPIWNNKNIDYVEIVARENVDVKGRTKYYDSYGVIRDMHQSHLTELLVLTVTNVINAEGKDEHELKNTVLQKVTHPFLHSTFIGQYRGYQDHLVEDTQTFNISKTPTYASVVLGVQDENWFGVPFYLTSGKAVAKREGFVRVVFRNNVRNYFDNVEECVGVNPEIKFTFNSDKLSEQQEQFVTVRPPMSGLIADYTNIINEATGIPCQIQALSMSSNTVPLHAYTTVITGLIRGDKNLFVPLTNILQSWKIWTPLLTELESTATSSHFSSNLVIYDSDLVDRLSLRAEGTKLISTYAGSTPGDSFTVKDSIMSMTSITSDLDTQSIHGHPVYVASRSFILNKIASDIHATALQSVNAKGIFNLALPGGSSQLELFQILSLDYSDTFPWQYTHIWQTDERCVDTSSPDSNINQLQINLLNLVNIPPSNIHPMLPERDSFYSYCKESSDGNDLLLNYDELVDQLFEDGSNGFDFVLLGMGRDGHVGSIFPENGIESYRSVGKHLAIVKLKDNYPIKVKERIALLMDTIARSNKVGLFLTGTGKCEIMELIYNQVQVHGRSGDIEANHQHKPVFQLIYNTVVKLTLYFDQNSFCN